MLTSEELNEIFLMVYDICFSSYLVGAQVFHGQWDRLKVSCVW